jgi:prepilin-type processing-associated H-X9-DG protein
MLAGDPAMRGQGLVRHFSLSGRMGGTPEMDSILGSRFPIFRKMADIRHPDPAIALVFVDESVQSIDDGFFAVQMSQTWMNSPTARHLRGASFSFADGHAERWKWRALSAEQDWWAPASAMPNTLVDLQRLQAGVAEQ